MGKRDKQEQGNPDAGESTPLRIDTTGTPLGDGPSEPLCYVDDREYRVPVEVPARLTLAAIRKAATEGRDAALWYLVEHTVPADLIHELTEGKAAEFVTREQVAVMLTGLGRRYLGQIDGLTGK